MGYNTRVSYTSDGTTTDYVLPFRYVDTGDVKVYEAISFASIPFTFVNPNMIRLTTAPVLNKVFYIARSTDLTNPKVQWKSGGGVTGDNLNSMTTQLLNSIQEFSDIRATPNMVGSVQPGTAPANNFMTGIDGQGVLIFRRPNATDVTGLSKFADGTTGSGADATATALSPNNQALWLAGAYTGSGQGPYAAISTQDTANSGGSQNPLASLRVDHDINSGAGAGNRFAKMVILNKNAALAGTNTGLKFYTPFFSQFYVKSGDGGTAGTPYGAHYGFSSLVQSEAGATYLDTMQGGEIDVAVRAGSSTAIKVGLLVATVNSDAVKGSQFDGAITIGADSTTTAKWSYGYTLGFPRGPWPFDTNSTLIGTVASTTARVANIGIDFSAVAFTTTPILMPNNAPWRIKNAAGSLNLDILKVDTSDRLVLGTDASGGVILNQSSSVVGTFTSTGPVAGFVADPRSGSGNSYQLFNAAGTSLTLHNGVRTIFTLDNNNDGSASLVGVMSSAGYATSAPKTITANYTVDSGATKDASLIANGSASITLTLPSAAANTGRIINIKNIAAFTVISASANVVSLAGGAATTSILAAAAGKFAMLQSDGTNWQIMMANSGGY